MYSEYLHQLPILLHTRVLSFAQSKVEISVMVSVQPVETEQDGGDNG